MNQPLTSELTWFLGFGPSVDIIFGNSGFVKNAPQDPNSVQVGNYSTVPMHGLSDVKCDSYTARRRI